MSICPTCRNLSDLPGFDEALQNSDGEPVIDLIGDNDITTGDGDDLIVTGLGDDTIDAGDGDNTVYADNVPSDSIGGDDEVTTGSGDDEILHLRWRGRRDLGRRRRHHLHGG